MLLRPCLQQIMHGCCMLLAVHKWTCSMPCIRFTLHYCTRVQLTFASEESVHCSFTTGASLRRLAPKQFTCILPGKHYSLCMTYAHTLLLKVNSRLLSDSVVLIFFILMHVKIITSTRIMFTIQTIQSKSITGMVDPTKALVFPENRNTRPITFCLFFCCCFF